VSGLWWCISLPNCCKNLVCRSLEMQEVTPRLDPRMTEDQISQKRLKALVQSLEWTYGVVWKLSSSDGWVSNSWPWELQRSFYSLWLSISTLGFLSVGISTGVVEIVLASDSWAWIHVSTGCWSGSMAGSTLWAQSLLKLSCHNSIPSSRTLVHWGKLRWPTYFLSEKKACRESMESV
jgi:hypothetical protein